MKGRSGWITFLAVTAAVAAFGALADASAAATAGRAVSAPSTTSQLKYLGNTNLRALASSPSRKAATTARVKPRQGTPIAPKPASSASASTPNPNPSSEPLTTQSGSNPFGFVGLSTADSGQLNGFDVEPPDQGLCAQGNQIMEPVNLAVDVYGTNGQPLIAPVSLNAFFGQAPAVGPDGTFGPFLSDPRCLFDVTTQRWFVTTLEIDVDPTTGALANHSHELIAVSQTADPMGSYAIFSIDSTNDGTDGTPSQPNCPCLGDQPRIGADAHGFYISDDSYSINALANSNGGMLYAISKTGLAAAANGGPVPSAVAIQIGAIPIHGNPANAVQPAEVPAGGSYPSNREYFLSTPDFNGFATSGGQGADSVVLWTLLNTASLNSSSPSLTLTDANVPSEPFTPPLNAAQRPGAHPLGESLGSPVEPLNVDDDRMQQVEFLNGQLYSSLETGVGSGDAARTGVAWFDVQTSGTSGTVAHQGYLAGAGGANLMYPAIGVNSSGSGAMTFSVSGRNNYPSAAYVPFNQGPRGSVIVVNGPGAAPEDGFTCYPAFGFGPPCRWGDYSAVSSDGPGRIVMGDEMIAGGPRDPDANWDTFISVYQP